MKSLDAKLAEIKANPSSRAFIIADAKDADMAFGVRAPGPRHYLSSLGARAANHQVVQQHREEPRKGEPPPSIYSANVRIPSALQALLFAAALVASLVAAWKAVG